MFVSGLLFAGGCGVLGIWSCVRQGGGIFIDSYDVLCQVREGLKRHHQHDAQVFRITANLYYHYKYARSPLRSTMPENTHW
jgi:hypothetical protein